MNREFSLRSGGVVIHWGSQANTIVQLTQHYGGRTRFCFCLFVCGVRVYVYVVYVCICVLCVCVCVCVVLLLEMEAIKN